MRREPRRRSGGISTLMPPVLRALSICRRPPRLLNAPATLAQPVDSADLAGGIPAQPLARALEAFARQTGLQLVYLSGVVRSQKAHAVPAGLSAPEALARMLEGTELTFEYLTPPTVSASLPRPLALRNQRTRGLSPARHRRRWSSPSTVREENVQNVPATVQVLTEATLARLNVTTFADFVTYLPGVTTHGVGPGQGNIYVRGLANGRRGPSVSG